MLANCQLPGAPNGDGRLLKGAPTVPGAADGPQVCKPGLVALLDGRTFGSVTYRIRVPDQPTSRQNRIWTAPDGIRYNVVVEEAPRHRVRQGDARPVMTFVELGTAGRQKSRLVQEGFPLDGATDLVLLTLLESAG